MSAIPPRVPGDIRPPSDDIFHLSPFLILDHHTISPVYHVAQVPTDLTQPQELQIPHDPSINPPASQLDEKSRDVSNDSVSQPLDARDEDNDDGRAKQNGFGNSRYVVPWPQNSREAYLLLEAARADRRILLARETLACQIIHRNTLVLQYNRMVLERAQDDLRAADRFIGHVRLLIRKSGQTAAFEYSMHEDPPSFPSEQTANYSSVDVDLT